MPVAGKDAASSSELVMAIAEYLADHPAAAVLEDGQVLFDMRLARFSVTESHGRCLLQLWSEERNLVRSVAGIEPRAHSLRLATRKMGVAKPAMLELVPGRIFARQRRVIRPGANSRVYWSGCCCGAFLSGGLKDCAQRWIWSTASARLTCAGK
jgi:hypothetical protein